MVITLKQAGNNVELHIDSTITTIIEKKNVRQVANWAKLNLKGIKIHIAK